MLNISAPSLGNDIVDLRSAERNCHERFPARICTKEELRLLREDSSLLWVFWAAKEAAYKTLKRLNPALYFSPAAFECLLTDECVLFQNIRLPLLLRITPEYIHAVCSTSQQCLKKSSLHLIVEHASSPQTASTDIRRQVEKLARAIFKQDIEISNEQDRWSQIPRLISKGKELAVLSLSHDGNYMAAALSELK